MPNTDRQDARLEAGRIIAEKWANAPDPEPPKAQRDALTELVEVKYARVRLYWKELEMVTRELEAARAAYAAGLDRVLIAKTLGRSLQTVHNWVNPQKTQSQRRRKYGDPTDEQLREAGIDV